ncbi:MAG: tape measure protein [Bacteroidales bacterium]|nr:tape measure protein [Bacteroidales bacterium]
MDLAEFPKLINIPSGPIEKFGAAANSIITKLTGRNKLLEKSYSQVGIHIKQTEITLRNSHASDHIKAVGSELEKLQQFTDTQQTPTLQRFGLEANSVIAKLIAGNKLLERSFLQAMKQAKQLKDTRSGSAQAHQTAKPQKFSSPVSFKGSSNLKLSSFIGKDWKKAALDTAVNGIINGGRTVVNSSLERQHTEREMQTLTGSEKAGTDLTNNLVALQKSTVLGKEVFENAQTMLNFGFNSTEIVKNLQMLGNVAMGDAGRLNTLTTAFSAIREEGKLTSQTLAQLIQGGFNPLEQISLNTGKSMAVLEQEMSRGLISFEQIKKAFQDATEEGGKYHNVLSKMGDTPAGKIMQLGSIMDDLKVKAGDALMPLMNVAMDLAQKVFPLMEKIITPLADTIQTLAGWISKGLANMFKYLEGSRGASGSIAYAFNTIKTFLTHYVAPTLGRVFNMIGKIVGVFLDFINSSQFIKDILDKIFSLYKAVCLFISVIAEVIGWIFQNILRPILKVFEFIYRITHIPQAIFRFLKEKVLNIFSRSDSSDSSDSSSDSTDNDYAKNKRENDEMATGLGETVTQGGPKTINILIPKFLDNINIYSSTLDEGAEDVERIFRELFGRVIAQGAITS